MTPATVLRFPTDRYGLGTALACRAASNLMTDKRVVPVLVLTGPNAIGSQVLTESRKLVENLRFELRVSCSQSRRDSRYPSSRNFRAFLDVAFRLGGLSARCWPVAGPLLPMLDWREV